jgi:hypothetical protein
LDQEDVKNTNHLNKFFTFQGVSSWSDEEADEVDVGVLLRRYHHLVGHFDLGSPENICGRVTEEKNEKFY